MRFRDQGAVCRIVIPDISPHKEKGIGTLTDAKFKRALTEGIGHDGRLLKLPMARQAFYSMMTQQDLEAIIAWVRSILPIE